MILKNLNEPECYNFFSEVLHLVNYFVEQFFIWNWNRSWLCKTDKSYCSRWYDSSSQAFQYNMVLLAWIKGTFNGEEGLGQKSSVQSIMHRLIGYIRFWYTFIYFEILNMAKFAKLDYFLMKDTLSLSMLWNKATLQIWERQISHANTGLFTVY